MFLFQHCVIVLGGVRIDMLRGSIVSLCHCMSQISFVLSDLFVVKAIVLFLFLAL